MENITVVLKGARVYLTENFYLQKVEILGECPETRHEGEANEILGDGTYIEGCNCHPEKSFTKVVEVIDGDMYSSMDVLHHIEVNTPLSNEIKYGNYGN